MDALKVLDFGLARATSDAPDPGLTHPPEATIGDTRAGVLVGTARVHEP